MYDFHQNDRADRLQRKPWSQEVPRRPLKAISNARLGEEQFSGEESELPCNGCHTSIKDDPKNSSELENVNIHPQDEQDSVDFWNTAKAMSFEENPTPAETKLAPSRVYLEEGSGLIVAPGSPMWHPKLYFQQDGRSELSEEEKKRIRDKLMEWLRLAIPNIDQIVTEMELLNLLRVYRDPTAGVPSLAKALKRFIQYQYPNYTFPCTPIWPEPIFSIPIKEYNCAGLAFRTYLWHDETETVNQSMPQPLGLPVKKILSNFREVKVDENCRSCEVKFWYWDIRWSNLRTSTGPTRALPGNPTNNYHIVSAQADDDGVLPSKIYTKAGPSPIVQVSLEWLFGIYGNTKSGKRIYNRRRPRITGDFKSTLRCYCASVEEIVQARGPVSKRYRALKAKSK